MRAFSPELKQSPQAIVGADPSDPRSAGCVVGAALLRGSRSNYLLKAVPPVCAEDFASEHDDSCEGASPDFSVVTCLTLLGRRWIAFLHWGLWFAQRTSSESSCVLGKLG